LYKGSSDVGLEISTAAHQGPHITFASNIKFPNTLDEIVDTGGLTASLAEWFNIFAIR
jgi:hypothetical protein